MGHVVQAGTGQAPGRQAALFAGLPTSVRAVTINKVCGSGLQAVMQAAHALHAGMGSVVVAGGMESMSRAPFLLPEGRMGHRLGHQSLVDSVIHDGLWDPHLDRHMGACGEQCATKYGFTREQQDAYARASFERALAAREASAADEIVPVDVPGARGATARAEHDEGPSRFSPDKMSSLKPAFDAGGTITAANASSLNDGAAALVVTTGGRATELAVAPIARIVSFGSHAQDPLWFTTAPVQAAARALQAAGWAVGDVDLWEVNEAFAVVPMAFMAELDVPHERMNVRGGAIALGHPIGCSGARILVTLISALRQRGLRRGLAAICIGGGEALAACVEVADTRP
jgi:acetyl-CoA C-acetyltransferase